jgi:hypothetical protein
LHHHIKNLATAVLCITLSQIAQAKVCEDNEGLYPCGLEFTTIPSVPSTIPNDSTTTVGPYVLTNVGSSPVTLGSVTLTLQSDDTAGGGVVFNGLTTCYDTELLNPSDTCDIYLDLEPNSAGLLDWDLSAIPQSTQRPLVLGVSSTVTGNYVGIYVTNNGASNSVSQCTVDNHGVPVYCTPVNIFYGYENSAPQQFGYFYGSIVINPAGTHAYLSNTDEGNGTSVSICPIIDLTTFGSGMNPCIQTDGFGGPMGLEINDAGTLLYVANSTDANDPGSTGGGVSYCSIDSNGFLFDCNYVDAGEAVEGIAVNSTYAFGSLTNSNQIIIYSVDSETGALSLPTFFSDISLDQPVGVGLYDGHFLATNRGNNVMFQCTLDGNTFTACTDPDMSPFSSSPAGFTLAIFKDTASYIISNLDQISGNYGITNAAGMYGVSFTPNATFSSPSDVYLYNLSF